VDQVCAFAAAVGGDAGVQIGPSCVPEGVNRQQCLDVYVDNLKYASVELARVNCRVMVEPMNRVDFPRILIPDVPSALQAIAEAGVGNLYLQFDCYHEAMNGGDVLSLIRRHYEQIEHFQFSDVPGRCEPGTGKLDIQQIFQTLDDVGYDNWVAAEYQPTGSSDESLDWFREYRSH
jgi:hydroxypyruvate isomerase